MKWYAISGSWRTIDMNLKNDVVAAVREIVKEKDGIIAGGALGVDYIATDVVLTEGNPVKQLKIYLPIRLADFCEHYSKRAREGVITIEQARMITSQLCEVKRLAPNSVYDNSPYSEANVESYYARNELIIESCDELFAFQVNNSQGTEDAIKKARVQGKPVKIRRYAIPVTQE